MRTELHKFVVDTELAKRTESIKLQKEKGTTELPCLDAAVIQTSATGTLGKAEMSLLSTRYGQTCLDKILTKTKDYSACLHDAQLKLLLDKSTMQEQEIAQLEIQLAQQQRTVFAVASSDD